MSEKSTADRPPKVWEHFRRNSFHSYNEAGKPVDGVCPGCGRKGEELCTPDCAIQSNPAPFTADPEPRAATGDA